MGLDVLYHLKARGGASEISSLLQQWRQSVQSHDPKIPVSKVMVLPGRASFHCAPGAGAERASFTLRTQDDQNWSGSWSCRTQYAARPVHGGIENFVLTHLRLIAALDLGARLSLVAQVCDDGGYWETRSLETLMTNLDRHEEVVRGLHRLARTVLPAKCVSLPH